jgi:hypothetical protein
LYFALGFSKDSATIPWLRARLKSHDAELICTDWLRGWEMTLSQPRGARWIDDRQAWTGFFLSVFRSNTELAAHHDLILYIPWSVDDQRVVDYYGEIRADAHASPVQLFLAAAFSRERAGQLDRSAEERLSGAVDALRSTDSGSEVLLTRGPEVATPEVVEWLIGQVETKRDSQPATPVQRALRRITFAVDVSGREDWETWYARNRGGQRVAWVRATLDQIDALVPDRTTEARDILRRYRLDWTGEPLLIPYLKKWVNIAGLRAEVACLISGRRMCFDYRGEIEPVVQIVIANSDPLPGSAKEALRSGGLLPIEQTWNSFVDEQFRGYVISP